MAEVLPPPPEPAPEPLPEPTPLPLRRRLRTVPGLVFATILVAAGVYLALQGMTAVIARGPGPTSASAPTPTASGHSLTP